MDSSMNGQDLLIAALINQLLALIVPAIVAFFRGTTTPVRVVGMIVAAVCIVASALSLWLQRAILHPPPTDAQGTALYYLGNLILIFTTAQVYYRAVYGTLLSGTTEALEQVGPKPGTRRH